MGPQNEHILLVESDSQISETIAQQILRPLGYQVDVFDSASSVIKDITKISPDVIITDLHLPGISGKDLLIALTSQGIDLPFIVITPKGHEADALQAFRLGAVNFITYPIRETEVIKVVEDTLIQIRKQHELEDYSRRLDQINKGIEQRINDYAEIVSIGKHLPSSASQQPLYERLIKVAITISRADSAWLLVVDQNSGKFILQACANCDGRMQSALHLPYENDLISLTATSNQTISLHGDDLNRFKLGDVGAVLVVPIKHGQKIIGMIAVEQKKPQPFTNDQRSLLEMIGDYATIFLYNFLRFQNLEQNLLRLQQEGISSAIDSDIKNDLFFQSSKELHNVLNGLLENLDYLSNQGSRRLFTIQNDALIAVQEEASLLLDITDAMVNISQGVKTPGLEKVDLNNLVHNVINHSQIIAQANRIKIKSEIPFQPTMVTIFTSQIIEVLEGLISNAIKHSPPKGQIKIIVEKKDNKAMVAISDQGEGIDEKLTDRIFDKKSSLFSGEGMRFGGIGISLPLMKRIISAHQGEIQIKSGHGKGFTVTFTLPQ
jgi:signal transduction histidine kinase/FixJ family two-component response regulator